MFPVKDVAKALDMKPELLKCVFKKDHAYYGLAKGTMIGGKNHFSLGEVVRLTEFFTRKRVIKEMRGQIEKRRRNLETDTGL